MTATSTLSAPSAVGKANAADARLFAIDDATAIDAVGAESACFVHRLDLATARFRALRTVLPDRVRLAYAVKSNPGQPLLAALAAEGAWFDCASAGEVESVARTVVDTAAGEVVLAGPGKRLTDLRAALDHGVRIQVDGIEDLARLDAVLTERGQDRPLAVSVRVNPLAGISEANRIIGGAGPATFGVDQEELPTFLDAATDYPRLRIDGLQVFAASNELDADTLLANHRITLDIGHELQERLGHELTVIDLGGGLGVPYAADEPDLDIGRLGAGLADLLDAHDWFTGRLLLEPGRWLSGPSGVYVTTVTRVKHSRGTSFAILAGGINHLLRPLLTGQSFPVRRAARGGSQPTDEPTRTYTLAGPLCTSLDRVGEADLPSDLAVGDVLVFGQAGAYSVTQAMTHFLSHPTPQQHWLS